VHGLLIRDGIGMGLPAQRIAGPIAIQTNRCQL
jgi:hypothetical protein